jgi:chromosome segregation ATPase
MALAVAVQDGISRSRKRLAAVADEPATTESLQDRLRAAQAAVTDPQRQVSELEAQLAVAVAAADFASAAKVQALLPAARETLALAEVDVRVLTETQARLNAQAAATQQSVTDAQRAAEGQQMLESALAGEQRALSFVSEALEQLYATVEAAREAYTRALDWEQKAGGERRRAHEARVMLGAAEPIARISAPDNASRIQETDPLVRILTSWRRPR